MLSLQTISISIYRLIGIFFENNMSKRSLIFSLLLFFTLGVQAQRNKVQRLPYIDQRLLHFGFSIGTHVQDLRFVNRGEPGDNGETWYAEIPSFSPGFNVGLVSDLYLCEYLNLRFCPTMYFGNKTIEMRKNTSDERKIIDIKSNYLSLPISIKYGAKRLNNYRPYITAGISPTLDLAKKKNDILRLKPYDTYLEIGFGCDIYLPFFKLIPELKFCFGLGNMLEKKRNDLQDPLDYKYTQSQKKITSQIVVLSFYFE